MSKFASQLDKSEEVPSKEEMVYCGEHELNPATKDVEDGVDGTLTIREGHRAASGAKPGEQIWLRVQQDDDEVVTKRKLHSTGRSVTLPLSDRQEIGLQPGQKVRYWIGAAEDGETSTRQSTSDRTDEEEDPYVFDESQPGLTYHVVDDDDDDVTVCGIDLSERSIRRFSDPGDALEMCSECNVRASADMSNREIVNWLADTIDEFEITGQNASYLTNEQLGALRDHIIELRDAQNA